MTAYDPLSTIQQLQGILRDLKLDWVIEQVETAIAEGKPSERRIVVAPARRPGGDVLLPKAKPFQYPDDILRQRLIPMPERWDDLLPDELEADGYTPDPVVRVPRYPGVTHSGGQFLVIEELSPAEMLDLYLSAIDQIARLVDTEQQLISNLGIESVTLESATGPDREIRPSTARERHAQATALRQLISELRSHFGL